MKLGFTMGVTMGSIMTFAVLQKNKINRMIRKAKNK